MWIERCGNRQCLRPYQVNEFGGDAMDGLPQPARIVCPHCGHEETRWSFSTFLVHALSAEEEAVFRERMQPPE